MLTLVLLHSVKSYFLTATAFQCLFYLDTIRLYERVTSVFRSYTLLVSCLSSANLQKGAK